MQIGKASRPKPGEIECGDKIVIVENGQEILLGVVDGLGHGPQAAKAAEKACCYIRKHSSDSLSTLMRGLHKAIAKTRGAAITLVRVLEEQGNMQHIGIGNVETAGLSRERIRPFCIPGIVGCSVRKVIENQYQITLGDIIVIHSDGISRRFDLEKYRDLPAQQIADALVKDWGKKHDDASCITIRF